MLHRIPDPTPRKLPFMECQMRQNLAYTRDERKPFLQNRFTRRDLRKSICLQRVTENSGSHAKVDFIDL